MVRLISTGDGTYIPRRFSIEPLTKSRVNRRRVRRGNTGGRLVFQRATSKYFKKWVVLGNLRRGRGAHVHVHPRFSASIHRVRVRVAHSCFVHVEGGRSIVLASQGCCTQGVGWNRIYSIRRWHINRTDNNTAAYPAAEPLPIQFTRRDVPRDANDENKNCMTTMRPVVDRSSETRGSFPRLRVTSI